MRFERYKFFRTIDFKMKNFKKEVQKVRFMEGFCINAGKIRLK